MSIPLITDIQAYDLLTRTYEQLLTLIPSIPVTFKRMPLRLIRMHNQTPHEIVRYGGIGSLPYAYGSSPSVKEINKPAELFILPLKNAELSGTLEDLVRASANTIGAILITVDGKTGALSAEPTCFQDGADLAANLPGIARSGVERPYQTTHDDSGRESHLPCTYRLETPLRLAQEITRRLASE